MQRGERNIRPIGLTIGRHAVQEFTFSQSPFGVAGRVIDRLTGRRDNSKQNREAQNRNTKRRPSNYDSGQRDFYFPGTVDSS